MIVHFLFVLLAGVSINSYNTGGVSNLDEAVSDTVQAVKEADASTLTGNYGNQ